MRRATLTASASALLVLTACASKPAAPITKSVTLGPKDSGRTVSVPVGDQIVIRLASNPSTGYSWHLSTKPGNAVLQSLGSNFETAPSPLIGQGGTDVWRFEAVGKGKTSLELTYVAPSGKPSSAGRFTLTVEVT